MINRTNQIEILLNALVKTPPQYIYHYASMSGLLGVMQSKSIWASDISSLNDKKEITHANSVLEYALESKLRSMGMENSTNFYEKIAVQVRSLEALFGRCVVSFCEGNDQLSLWRPYASDGKGASIGFLSNAMAKVAAEQGFALRKVIYDWSTQCTICNIYIEDMFSRFKISVKISILTKEIMDDMRHFINTIGIFFKHYSFEDEKEWRLVSSSTDVHDTRWKYRAGENMIIPYLAVDLYKLFSKDINIIEKSDENLPPFIITLGPRVRLSPTAPALQGVTHSILGIGYGVTLSSSPYQG